MAIEMMMMFWLNLAQALRESGLGGERLGDALHDFVVLLQAVVDESAFNQADEEDIEDQIQDYEG